MIDSGSGSAIFQIIYLVFFCILPLFILYQGWIVVKYIYARIIKPQEKKAFPVFSSVILAACCLLLTAASIYVINNPQ